MAVASTPQSVERHAGSVDIRVMKLRIALRQSLTASTLAAAGATAAAGNVGVAALLLICAVIVFVAVGSVATEPSPDDIKAILESLNTSQLEGAPVVNAVVTSAIIFIGKSVMRGATDRRNTLLFRDEIEAHTWREMMTLLRHQAHPSPDAYEVGQNGGLALGKRSDL